MTKVKNQHYVPQCYLERFTRDRGQVFVFDKVERRSYVTNVRNAASETYFYDFSAEIQKEVEDWLADVPESELSPDLRTLLRDPQLVERSLSKMEEGFASTLDEVVKTVDATGEFTYDQRMRLAYFVTMQLVRGPEFRKSHLERAEKTMDAISQMLVAMKFGDDAVGRVRVRLNKQHATYEHARMMYDKEFIQGHIEVLLSHIWHIGISTVPEPLYTSDTPVAMRSHLNDASYGIGSTGVEIMFPLGPRHILVMHERQHFMQFEHADYKTIPLGRENVLYFNSGQVLGSYRHVYSSVSEFELAVNLCAENPEICDPDRDRIQISGGVQDLLVENTRRKGGDE
jgi:hypothetical protein